LIEGGLFTRDFLLEGIREQEAWKALDDDSIAGIRQEVLTLFGKLTKTQHPSEPVTEKDLIYPLLRTIGWGDLVHVQPNLSAKGRADVPDALLFADEDAHDRARREKDDWKRFRHGICIVEAKRWGRVLDREDNRTKGEDGVPSTQMLRYLRRVDDVTEGRLRWGILTNGRQWRLYWQGALSVAEDFLEIDLGKVLDLPGCELDLIDRAGASPAEIASRRDHALKLFVILFSRGAFLPLEHGKSFHDVALAKGKFWEEQVARDLSNIVFDKVFPDLADAIAKADPKRDPALGPAYLDDLRQAALILLYRLLFVLYAEDRNLLPDESGPYMDYCLRRVRLDIADQKASGRTFPASFVTIWPKLTSIFRAISQGDDALGIPPYNGGLFDPASAPVLERVQLPDAVVADVVFALSHINNRKDGRGPKYINYRDLSVQQLGSVYERILEHGLRATPDGKVEIAADDEARHSSGSYYTPDSLVALIIERAAGPLVVERLKVFEKVASRLASDKRPTKVRLADLAEVDPATHPRSQDLRSRHGLRPFPCQPSRLACRPRSCGDGRSDRSGAVGDLYVAACRAHCCRANEDIERSQEAPLASRRGAARRPSRRPPHGLEARRLRPRQEPDGGGVVESRSVASLVHRWRAALVPRSPFALRRQHPRRLGTSDRRCVAGARRPVQSQPDHPRRARRRADVGDRADD
jgi:hypothetical protein